jgi:hypothetical protein
MIIPLASEFTGPRLSPESAPPRLALALIGKLPYDRRGLLTPPIAVLTDVLELRTQQVRHFL